MSHSNGTERIIILQERMEKKKVFGKCLLVYVLQQTKPVIHMLAMRESYTTMHGFIVSSL